MNGVIYKFYSDIEEPNRMDDKPFFEFDLMRFDDASIAELKKFAKNNFDIENVLSNASELKYTKEIMKHLGEELDDPSEDFVRLLAGKVYSGRFTASVINQFKVIVEDAFKKFIKTKVNERIKSALDTSSNEDGIEEATHDENEDKNDESKLDGIETTEDEIEGYHIVKAILSNVCDPERIFLRDTKSYCSVIIDDSNRKPVIRMRFNTRKKYIGLLDEEKIEEKLLIEKMSDIYDHKDRIINMFEYYESST